MLLWSVSVLLALFMTFCVILGFMDMKQHSIVEIIIIVKIPGVFLSLTSQRYIK